MTFKKAEAELDKLGVEYYLNYSLVCYKHTEFRKTGTFSGTLEGKATVGHKNLESVVLALKEMHRQRTQTTIQSGDEALECT